MVTSLKQVLVHLDATPSVIHRLDAARHLSGAHGADLTAMYAVMPAFVELPYAPDIGPLVANDLAELDRERRAGTLKAFDRAMKGPGPVAHWSEANDLPIGATFSQQALFADLLVLGQHQPDEPTGRSVPTDFVESVLAQSGRPAVVIPYTGWTRPLGDVMAIAWKETPEAARAVTAALPLLMKASGVHVLAWGAEPQPNVGGQRLDLDGYLQLHGITATWHDGGPEPREIGELLLSRSFDVGADLLVMGCYGHSRAREWVLGGATRSILRAMTLPVLMAH